MAATKNIFYVKGEGRVDYSTVVTRGFNKFHLRYKNFNDQASSGKPKIRDYESMLQAIEANPGSSTWRVSGELSISA